MHLVRVAGNTDFHVRLSHDAFASLVHEDTNDKYMLTNNAETTSTRRPAAMLHR